MYDRDEAVRKSIIYLQQSTFAELAKFMIGLVSSDSDDRLADLLHALAEQARLRSDTGLPPERLAGLTLTSYTLQVLSDTVKEIKGERSALQQESMQHMAENIMQANFLQLVDVYTYPMLQKSEADILKFLADLSEAIYAHYLLNPNNLSHWKFVAIQLKVLSMPKSPP